MSIIYCRKGKTQSQKKRIVMKKERQEKFEIKRGIKEPENKKLLPLNKGKCVAKDYFNVGGVYFLYKDDSIVYVGESACIFTRIKAHLLDKDFDYFRYIIYGSEERRKIAEVDFIRKYRPIYNKSHNTDKMKSVYYGK